MIWNNIYPAEAHKLEHFRKVARKSEELGLPCFRETSQHFGGTCKPATVSKGYRSNKSLGNPAVEDKTLLVLQYLLNAKHQNRAYLKFFYIKKDPFYFFILF